MRAADATVKRDDSTATISVADTSRQDAAI